MSNNVKQRQTKSRINLPETGQPRIVIVGAGFGGLRLARKLTKLPYQVVLLDTNNYHQFQPLFYQVAMAGLEPSSIVFPLRKLFQKKKNIYIRCTYVQRINADGKYLQTSNGRVNFDYLVIATGTQTNFFGNEEIARNAIPMKSVSEALFLRNAIFSDYETALTIPDFDERQAYMDIVVVGGGPTGVEIAGSLAEMKQYVFPKDYPEMDCDEIDIYLLQSGDTLLKGMSAEASKKAYDYLVDLGVKVEFNSRVTGYDGKYVQVKDKPPIFSRKVIWGAGVTGNLPEGLPETAVARGNRVVVNELLQTNEHPYVFAIGDIASNVTEEFPYGHPQLAPVAMQMADTLAKNFKRQLRNQPPEPFRYHDKGSMATIGRGRAVVDLPNFKFQGFFAWLTWLAVHLVQILGTKNKLFVFLNWAWNYVRYDQSLRLIIRPRRLSKRERETKF